MKLNEKQIDALWGVDGPYSQVHLIVETRILDDRVSRIFVLVEASINPFTFELVQRHRERFADVVIGLSDHQNGIAMALAAYMLGAQVIEKHFTLNRAWKGTDHAFSLEPIGMRKLVRDLRRARLAIGDGIKRPLPCEIKPLFKMAKKLVAARDLPAGRVLTREDIVIKSPGDGLPPYELESLIGKATLRALKEDENISFDDLRDR
jgi:N-acetylneuraminate synthase/sialic acid synthase